CRPISKPAKLRIQPAAARLRGMPQGRAPRTVCGPLSEVFLMSHRARVEAREIRPRDAPENVLSAHRRPLQRRMQRLSYQKPRDENAAICGYAEGVRSVSQRYSLWPIPQRGGDAV